MELLKYLRGVWTLELKNIEMRNADRAFSQHLDLFHNRGADKFESGSRCNRKKQGEAVMPWNKQCGNSAVGIW